MPRAYRAALLLLALLVLGSGVLGVVSALFLEGWPLLRGVANGLVAIGLGGWLTWVVLTERWPRWMASLLGEDDAV